MSRQTQLQVRSGIHEYGASIVGGDDMRDQRQPDPMPWHATLIGASGEALEDSGSLVGRDARARVVDAQPPDASLDHPATVCS